MDCSITHFETYGREPSQLADYHSQIFGANVERMPDLDYWRIFPHANENGPLHGGLAMYHGKSLAQGLAEFGGMASKRLPGNSCNERSRRIKKY